jgi:hypothetical protein
METRNILPAIIIIAIIALMIAAKFAHASDEKWIVFQDGFRCCSFQTLNAAQSFVLMQEGRGNTYVIYKE